MKGSVYLEKDCTRYLKQVEQNEADGHNTLGRYLTARDLAAFGIAAIIGWYFTIGKAVLMVVLPFFSCSFTLRR
jgi:hypothetical protein